MNPSIQSPHMLIENNRHSLQRKAAIAWGKGTDHAGHVSVEPITDFDLGKTIFTTLEGKLPRMVIEAKIAKSIHWDNAHAQTIEEAYAQACKDCHIPQVKTDILEFMVQECDFSMEHADGTFLEHLIFCHDYAAIHFPQQSPTIQLLHSILGTATNTFAMKAEKIPHLFSLLSPEEQLHIEAFPSFLRLIAELSLIDELTENLHRLNDLKSITYHRVIDNQECEVAGQDIWNQLNHQLIHFVDFLPAANWAHHSSDPVLQSMVRLSAFLDQSNKRLATVRFNIPKPKGPFTSPLREKLSFGGRVSSFIPASIKKSLAAKSVRRFSQKIGHDLNYTLNWR